MPARAVDAPETVELDLSLLGDRRIRDGVRRALIERGDPALEVLANAYALDGPAPRPRALAPPD